MAQPHNYRVIVYITCLIVVATLDILKVMLSGRIREKLTPHNIHIVNRISGMILIAFGLALILGTIEIGDKIW